MSDIKTTQEIEADEIIDSMNRCLDVPPIQKPCTPEAHSEVVGVQREILRGVKWTIRHMDANKRNGHSAKLKLGPFSISGVSATVVYRLSALAGVGYLIAKAKGWLP